ncbi:MAG: sigma 54-interacting transcriptional regulator [Lentisphaeria bacterium]|jgi:transcriptional regulator with GAF, ATPase, and Fis domain|nr:sigma 54-interacting transcriptional regulator [Lentisphaeria bacterium]
MLKFVLKSTWKTAFVAAAASALILLLVQAADHLPGKWGTLAETLRGFAWLAVLGNAVFVFWMVHRLAAPMRNLVDQARAKGLAPEPGTDAPFSTLRPHTDELGEMADICQRITHALPVLEARQLFPEIVCGSRAMLQVLTVIERVARTDTTVLVQGESGTGKELVARSIHRRSARQNRPFVPINCAAIPASLLESELFGHEKGAFTGALQRRIGRFEIAEGGTVFLDEIGEMPLDMQAKLLRVLQERTVTPVGGNRTVPVDVRIVAATNRNLDTMVAAGTFRQDLFFRLSVLPLRLPPLRERPGDIPILVHAFLHRLARPDTRVSPEAMRFLAAHPWPGNVRELENAIEAALVIAEDTIRPEHLPPRIAPDPRQPPPFPAAMEPATPDFPPPAAETAAPVPDIHFQEGSASLDDTLAAIERKYLIDALEKANGVQVEAARILGIKERSLWHRIKKYNLDPSIFRHPGNQET